MSTDQSFFTNQSDETLQEHFGVLIKHSQFFDCLVGYFYLSGFHTLYPQLEDTDKIRILVGMRAEQRASDFVRKAKEKQQVLGFPSTSKAKKRIAKSIIDEMEQSDDSRSVEESIYKFVEWLISKKLEIRFYTKRPIHAKVYIMTFKEGGTDVGRVITGSSNFSRGGFVDNIEFNVALRDPRDYNFAKKEFEKLWRQSSDISEQYQETIEKHTWLRKGITPYELYLKFLYEYFKDELSQSDRPLVDGAGNLPTGFMDLAYQRQAVRNARKILSRYGGVFISDVVGLGKTYITALLMKQLDGQTLVIAPPALLDSANPGSWKSVFLDFGISVNPESVGKLDAILDQGVERYKNIIIDEAHRFRNDETSSHEKLMQICRGKRVILVTATPYHNKPNDILSLLRLFQNAKKSTIPNISNLEKFFKEKQKNIEKYHRDKKHGQYMKAVRDNTRAIRTSVLKHIMVRRTRKEVEECFKKDLKKQGIHFPKINEPVSLSYTLNETENRIFDKTIRRIAQQLTYARYTPMLYYVRKKEDLTSLQVQSQRNMGGFMKVLLCKRLESSFHAFGKSIGRFLDSYERVIKTYHDKGHVYVSKGSAAKLYEFLAMDDDEAIEKLIAADKAVRYQAEEFLPTFMEDLRKDRNLLQEIQNDWQQITTDPKLDELLNRLREEENMQRHLLIFTEAKETAEYLHNAISQDPELNTSPLLFTSRSKPAERKKVTNNFDANIAHPSDEHRILISTEILAEGVNLHRANTVLNYDLPWNPTRMMQRVGRINRVNTPAREIHTFNFFPAEEADEQLNLMNITTSKIHAFLTLLGGDAELLTEGEPVDSHALFERLTSEETLTGEDPKEESELKYLAVIRAIREKNAELFEKIKNLPKKARAARASDTNTSSLLTYFRQDEIQMFFRSAQRGRPEELGFIAAAKILECEPDAQPKTLPAWFHDELDKNKVAFVDATTETPQNEILPGAVDSATKISRRLKRIMKYKGVLTEPQEEYMWQVIKCLEDGRLTKPTLKKINKKWKVLPVPEREQPLKVIPLLEDCIENDLLREHYGKQKDIAPKAREVILSLCLTAQ